MTMGARGVERLNLPVSTRKAALCRRALHPDTSRCVAETSYRRSVPILPSPDRASAAEIGPTDIEDIRMTRFKKITLITVALAAIGAGSLAIAGRGGHGPERMVERVSDRLELDAGQSDALLGFVTEMQSIRTLMRGGELRDDGLALLQSDTLDQGAALTLLETRADALRAQAPDLVAAAAVFYDGLNAEQREEVRAFAERGSRFGRRD